MTTAEELNLKREERAKLGAQSGAMLEAGWFQVSEAEFGQVMGRIGELTNEIDRLEQKQKAEVQECRNRPTGAQSASAVPSGRGPG